MCYVHNQWYDISCATLYLLCTGGYYATLICSVPPVVQGSHPGVCRVSSWGV